MSFADILGNETSWSGITSMITIKNDVNRSGITSVITVKNDVNRSGITGVITFSIQSCRTCYATQHLCQRSFYKIFVKFRNSKKKNVLKIILIIVNINKDENKSLILNQISLKNNFPPPTLLGELFCGGKN
jgi:hypothetical protein